MRPRSSLWSSTSRYRTNSSDPFCSEQLSPKREYRGQSFAFSLSSPLYRFQKALASAGGNITGRQLLDASMMSWYSESCIPSASRLSLASRGTKMNDEPPSGSATPLLTLILPQVPDPTLAPSFFPTSTDRPIRSSGFTISSIHFLSNNSA